MVTGAGGGLGAEFCTALAREGAATVVGVDVADQAATRARVESVGGTFPGVQADIASEDDCDAVADRSSGPPPDGSEGLLLQPTA